jgi:cysteine desulfurase
MKRDDTAKLGLLVAASAVSAVSLCLFLLLNSSRTGTRTKDDDNKRRRGKGRRGNGATPTASSSSSLSDKGASPSSSSSSSCIYLDYNGTTPVYPEVYRAMKVYFEKHFGNPGSTHCFGDEPRKALAAARRTILEALSLPSSSTNDTNNTNNTNSNHSNDSSSSIIFCACGTEADNLAIHLALQQHQQLQQDQQQHQQQKEQPLPHVVTTNVEHPAVAKCLDYYERGGICTVTRVPVDPDGCVTTGQVMAAVRSET